MPQRSSLKMPLLKPFADQIFKLTDAKWLMITRSEEGISIFNQESGRQDFPVTLKKLRCHRCRRYGFGDIAASVANKMSPAEGSHLCNIAAGSPSKKSGGARVTLKELAKRLLEYNMSIKFSSTKNSLMF